MLPVLVDSFVACSLHGALHPPAPVKNLSTKCQKNRWYSQAHTHTHTRAHAHARCTVAATPRLHLLRPLRYPNLRHSTLAQAQPCIVAIRRLAPALGTRQPQRKHRTTPTTFLQKKRENSTDFFYRDLLSDSTVENQFAPQARRS